ncbi:MAG: hypothetical protein AAGJ79_08695 [Verrucomicrobiota bacterium]
MKLKPVLIACLCGLATAATGYVAGRVIFNPGPAADDSTGIGSIPKVNGSRLSRSPDGGPAIPGLSEDLQKDADELQAALRRGGIRDFVDRMEIVEPDSKRAQLLLEAAANFTSDEFAEFFSFMVEDNDRYGDLFGDEELAIFLIEDWVNIDADSAIEFGLQQEGEMMFLSAVGLLFLAAHDYAAAEAKIDEVREILLVNFSELYDEEADIAEINSFVAMGLALDDPVEALRRMREEGLELDDYDTLFEMNPRIGAPMLEEILLFEDPQKQGELMKGFFETWGRKDPEAALAGMERLMQNNDLAVKNADGLRSQLTKEIFELWAKTDPQKALESLDRIDPDAEKDDILFNVAGELAKTNPDKAIQIVEKLLNENWMEFLHWDIPTSLKFETLGDAMLQGDSSNLQGLSTNDPFGNGWEELVREDPDFALLWSLEKQNGPNAAAVNDLAYEIGYIQAELDMDHAAAILSELPNGDFKTRFLSGIFNGGSEENPIELAELVSEGVIKAGDVGENAEWFVHDWIHNDPASTLQFVREVGEHHYNIAVEEWAESDITTAFNYLAENGDPAVSRFVQETEFHEHWIEQDAFGGAVVIANLPPENAAEAMAVYVTQWAGKAPEEASVFINDSIAPGPVRDAAIVSLAASIAADDPAGARQWINAIGDPTLRAEAMHAVQTP